MAQPTGVHEISYHNCDAGVPDAPAPCCSALIDLCDDKGAAIWVLDLSILTTSGGDGPFTWRDAERGKFLQNFSHRRDLQTDHGIAAPRPMSFTADNQRKGEGRPR